MLFKCSLRVHNLWRLLTFKVRKRFFAGFKILLQLIISVFLAVIDKVTNTIKSYDFTLSENSEWVLKERVQKSQTEQLIEQAIGAPDEPVFRLLAPVPKEFKAKSGEDVR